MVAPVEDSNAQTDHSRNMRDKKRQLCYEVTKAAYDFTIKDMDSLDAKASNMITFVGIIVGIYSGFGKGFLDSIDKTKYLYDYIAYYNIALIILMIGLLVLLISIACALVAYKLYNITIVPYPPYFYEHYITNDAHTADNILDNLTVAFVSAFQLNNNKRGEKAFFISWSFITLLIGSAIGVIFMVIVFVAPKG
jgi:hypothetical protein